VSSVGHLLSNLIGLYIYVLIGRLILDYAQMFARDWRPRGIFLMLAEVIYTVTDPPLRALRRIIPPIRLGTVSLDLSFLVLIIGLQILQNISYNL
jgi:YggT family protein